MGGIYGGAGNPIQVVTSVRPAKQAEPRHEDRHGAITDG